jgi:hypothetical protein
MRKAVNASISSNVIMKTGDSTTATREYGQKKFSAAIGRDNFHVVVSPAEKNLELSGERILRTSGRRSKLFQQWTRSAARREQRSDFFADGLPDANSPKPRFGDAQVLHAHERLTVHERHLQICMFLRVA